MRVTRREPVKAWLVMEAIKEETRQKIIQLLLEKKEMTLTEIQEHVKKTLPTLLFHMNALEKAGIITWKTAKKGKKTTKVYKIKTKILEIEIDIEVFSKISNMKTIDKIAKDTINKLQEKGIKIKKDISIDDLVSTGLDALTALIVKDYIENYEEEIAKYLYEKHKEVLDKTNDPIEIAEKLNIDVYWAARLLQIKK